MAVFCGLRLVCLAVLMLASQLDFASAAVRISALYANGLTGDLFGKPDPYVKVWCGNTFGGQTEYISDNDNPRWSAEFNFPKCKANNILKMEVWDKDLIFDDKLGVHIRILKNGVSNTSWSVITGGTMYFTVEVK